MKKAVLGVLSLLSGSTFASEKNSQQTIKFTTTSPENVILAVGIIRELSINLEAESVSLILNNLSNSVQVNVEKVETATALISKLKKELGEEIVMEMIDYGSISHASQDGIMKP